MIDDAGSGQAIDLTPFDLPGEPTPCRRAFQPARTCCCSAVTSSSAVRSAALVAGKTALVQRIEKDPLMRAFRLDKMTLAALEANAPALPRSENGDSRAVPAPNAHHAARGTETPE